MNPHMIHNKNPTPFHHHHHDGNPQPHHHEPIKKSIPKSNQTNSKFRIQKMTHKKKNQVKIYTNLATNWSHRYKPCQKPMNTPPQTTIPCHCISMNSENVPKNTQKLPPYHADLNFPVSPLYRTHDPCQNIPSWSPPYHADLTSPVLPPSRTHDPH